MFGMGPPHAPANHPLEIRRAIAGFHKGCNASDLHAFTGVAELKRLELGRALRVRQRDLHAFTGVAELKHGHP